MAGLFLAAFTAGALLLDISGSPALRLDAAGGKITLTRMRHSGVSDSEDIGDSTSNGDSRLTGAEPASGSEAAPSAGQDVTVDRLEVAGSDGTKLLIQSDRVAKYIKHTSPAAGKDGAAATTSSSDQLQQRNLEVAQWRPGMLPLGGSWSYRSWAADLIRHDFRHWADTGIQLEALEEMVSTKRYRWGSHIDAFRFQIIGGQLYVDTTDIYPGSGASQVQWYPSETGPGGVALYGRAPLQMLALLELLRLYPGQVPDVDALLIFPDMPVVNLTFNPLAAPLFCACSNDDFAEIPFPDWTYWSGQGGWDAQRRELLTAAAAHPLAGRKPALMYRGRAMEDMLGDAKRAAVVDCSRRLPKQHRRLVDAKSVVWPSKHDAVPAATQCQWRYLIYIESYGYSASLRSRLACGAVLLQVKPVWVEWYSRGLQKGRHYLEIAAEPLQAVCPDVLATLLAVERASGDGGGSSSRWRQPGKPSVPAGVTLQPGFGDNSTAKQVSAKGLSPKLEPAAISAAQTAFVKNQLRMQDVRDYMLDALGTYAALQRFTPKASAGAVHVTPDHLLRQFLYDADRAAILEAHPWLKEGP